MNSLQHALRGARFQRRPPPLHRQVLVLGAGGNLGTAVVEQLLASGGFAEVMVAVDRPINTALRGLLPLDWPQPPLAPAEGSLADTALVVFDRERFANGRDDAFLRPEPADLPVLAAQLRQAGVPRLLVIMPHAPAGLPEALRRGLASLDEQSVAAAGFEQLLLMRLSQAGPRSLASGLHRLAEWMLRQLQFMLPPTDRPVRAQKVAELAVQLALQLPEGRAGTRVVPPELVWQAAQSREGVAALAGAWLRAEEGLAPEAGLPLPLPQEFGRM